MSEVTEYQSWVCLICGWVYNEAEGLPDDGIPAGTRFADIPPTGDARCAMWARKISWLSISEAGF